MHGYFFDVTDIMRYVKTETSISGIQRVSLEIIRRMLARYGSDRVRLCYWDKRAGRYYVRDAGFLAGMNGFDVDVLGAVFFGARARQTASVPVLLQRYRNQPLKYRFHQGMATVQALRGNARYFQSRGSSIEEWRHRGQEAGGQGAGGPVPGGAHAPRRDTLEAVIAPGDRIVVLGAGWGIAGMDECLQRLVEDKGADVSLMIHDLIPLIAPEHIADGQPLEFYRWLENSAAYCRRYLANSAHTARDLAAFMEETGKVRPIDVIPLAQQGIRSAQTPQEAGPDRTLRAHALRLRGLDSTIVSLTKAPYVLVVGTMESRKNLWRLAQVWARLAQDRDINAPRLVLAGKRSPENTEFNAWMQHSGNLGGWIGVADRPSDDALSYLYENCLFTATVSLYEGWGLPIGESLAFGKTAVVADNSSMPQVGGDMVAYCDAGSIDSIYRACRRLIADPAHRHALEQRIRQTRLRSWDDVTDDLVRKLDAEPGPL